MDNELNEVKKRLYKREETLSHYAMKAINSRGREINEDECPFRTVFQRDRDRILYSKAFRRLKGKTQVFYAPENDHLRTRLTHTIEVSQISRTIARILNLNEDLTEAIALGHDLGHAPFGHSGEEALNSVIEGGFKHNVHSVRVVRDIEKLNLTIEVIDGILNHTGPIKPMTLEGQIVKISDRIAYLSHDLEDALREEVISKGDVPSEFIEYFGSNKKDMINKLILNIYFNSVDRDEIKMDDNCVNFLNNLRSWMFKNVYFSDKTKGEEQIIKKVVIDLFNYYKNKYDEQGAIDYVAGMSDEFALREYEEIFNETIWLKSPLSKQLKR